MTTALKMLYIPRDAVIYNTMSEDDLVLHKVHNPKMFVFTTEFNHSFTWPSKLEHSNQTYEFVSKEVMPRQLASQYGGYALYEIKTFVQHPITHRELGAFMVAMGTAMMSRHIDINEAYEPAEQQHKRDLIASLKNTLDNCGEERAQYIAKICYNAMRTANLRTIDSN